MLGVHVPLVNLTQKLVQGVLQDVVVLSKEKKQLDRGGGVGQLIFCVIIVTERLWVQIPISNKLILFPEEAENGQSLKMDLQFSSWA